MKPDGENIAATVKLIEDEEGKTMESAPHPCQTVVLPQLKRVHPQALLRRRKPEDSKGD